MHIEALHKMRIYSTDKYITAILMVYNGVFLPNCKTDEALAKNAVSWMTKRFYKGGNNVKLLKFVQGAVVAAHFRRAHFAEGGGGLAKP